MYDIRIYIYIHYCILVVYYVYIDIHTEYTTTKQ